MRLSEVVLVSEQVAATRSRNEKIERLARALAALTEAEVGVAVSYLMGALPQPKLGLGYAAAHGTEAAAALEPTLGLLEVDAAFEQLAALAGKGSTTERKRRFAELLAKATQAEQRFLRGLIVGELRQGALEGVMVEAVAKAFQLPPPAVRRAVMLSGSVAAVARAALARGLPGVEAFRLMLMRPLSPMLAGTAGDVEEALASLGEAAFELKLDGARVQLHKDHELVRVFSREGNDVTHAVPELVTFASALPAKTLVLDGEAIALRPDGSPLPFQVTMSRFGRKRDDPALRASLPLSPVFFDVLHHDGADVLDAPYVERARRLDALVPAMARAERPITGDLEAAEQFFASTLARGHEGVVVKSLTAEYDAGRRGEKWLKLKPAHTLDLVVLAVEWGSGRRQGFLSNLHLGARDGAGFAMLGKTFKGMTDAMLAWQTEALLKLEVSRDSYTVYVRPELVVEIAFDSVLQSSQYASGMALRFARVKRYRQDKRVEEADTIEAVRAIFERGRR